MSGKRKPMLNFEEYLAFERKVIDRHEFLDGQIYARAGESLSHSTICANLTGELHTQLKGKPCRTLSPNMKVRSGPYLVGSRMTKGMFSYADATVVCDQPLFHDEHQDVLLNPRVLFEVLSPSTENFDRGEKFHRYARHLASLTDYVLISQNQPMVEHFHRQEDGTWIYRVITGLTEFLELPTIDCWIQLSDLYDRIEFPPAEEDLDDSELEDTIEPS
ncbi:MAG TPA: Uma2 family endonuclease [Acidobacteriota bacterium]|nr:Uma2 family endonuclease [Acidobacteriota bacterium]HNG91483.1 Uma2 family endonuclease [Acidobacteriota bacterium]HNJ43839.1 Uma2 family endonuclease [Acidobacteriota bacterium]